MSFLSHSNAAGLEYLLRTHTCNYGADFLITAWFLETMNSCLGDVELQFLARLIQFGTEKQWTSWEVLSIYVKISHPERNEHGSQCNPSYEYSPYLTWLNNFLCPVTYSSLRVALYFTTSRSCCPVFVYRLYRPTSHPLEVKANCIFSGQAFLQLDLLMRASSCRFCIM